jgi:uncharacterized membrane protein YbhN (UPF0104 family)
VSRQHPVWRRRLWLAAKIAVIALVVGFVWRTLVDAWDQLGEYPWEFRGGWIAVAAIFYLFALFPPAVFWFSALRALGQHPRFWEAIRAYYIGHLGKYVPGKAMVVILRAGLIRGERVDTGVAAASVFLESLTWISVGAVLAAGYLATHLAREEPVFWLSLGVMAATGIPTLPHVFPRLAKLAGVGKQDPAIVEKLDALGLRTTVLGWVLMTVGWVFMGLANWSTFRAMGLPSGQILTELPRFIAAASLAIVVGFVAIFAPGGIGVREAVLVKVMIPYLRQYIAQAEVVAWGASLLFRVVSVVSELAISAMLYGVNFAPAKPPEKDHPH